MRLHESWEKKAREIVANANPAIRWESDHYALKDAIVQALEEATSKQSRPEGIDKVRGRLHKGACVSVDGWWYVVVHVIVHERRTMVQCICDNANNIYTWDVRELTYVLSGERLRQALFGYLPDDIPDDLRTRGVPRDVIAETMIGMHDDRWEEE